MNTKPAKGFKQISLPSELVDEITKAADLADRSVPKQIEHCFKVARAVEQVLPEVSINTIKASPASGRDILKGLINTLLNPDYTAIIEKNGYRISIDPSDQSKHIKTYPDGSKERGYLDHSGNFIAVEKPSATNRWVKIKSS